MYNSPKPFDAMITAVICIVLIALGYKAPARVLTALNIGALIFAIITAIILWTLILEAANRRVDVITDWMKEFSKLDEEARAAVAFQFPTIRYHMKRGKVREMFEDTQVPIEIFRLFLKTSNNRYISPRRDWTTEERPAWAWDEIKNWLEEKDYIIADSAAGSHSWLWSGEAYRHLTAYWMSGRHLQDMSATNVYAYEE